MTRQLYGACANCAYYVPTTGPLYPHNVGLCTRDVIFPVFDSARPTCFTPRENGARPASGGCADRAPVISASGVTR